MCGKLGHFKAVCRSVKRNPRVNTLDIGQVEHISEQFSNAVLTIDRCSISDYGKIKDPVFEIQVQGITLQGTADSGPQLRFCLTSRITHTFQSRVYPSLTSMQLHLGALLFPYWGILMGNWSLKGRVLSQKFTLPVTEKT